MLTTACGDLFRTKDRQVVYIGQDIGDGEKTIALAKTLLRELLAEVVAKRPKATVNASNSLRRGTRSDYPLSATTKVRFAPREPLREGLVLDRRAGDITVHQVSGTSVTVQDIASIGSVDDALYLLCLLRQEIFISEGRRMTDLGIRFRYLSSSGRTIRSLKTSTSWQLSLPSSRWMRRWTTLNVTPLPRL